MCFTNDDRLTEIMRSIRIHGKGDHKYDNVRIGINGRLDTLQAAILHAKFDIFPEEVKLRREVADRYTALLSPDPSLLTPHATEGCHSAWAQYSLLAESEAQRTALMDKLKAAGIPTAIYYPKPLHMQTAFASLGYKLGAFPVSENAADRIFSIPMHPYLTEQDQTKIAEAIKGLSAIG